MIGMAKSPQVVRIKEKAPIAAMRGDMELSAHDVVDVGRERLAAADDAELAERIAGEDEGNGALAPGHSVVETLETISTASAATLARSARGAIVRLMSGAV